MRVKSFHIYARVGGTGIGCFDPNTWYSIARLQKAAPQTDHERERKADRLWGNWTTGKNWDASKIVAECQWLSATCGNVRHCDRVCELSHAAEQTDVDDEDDFDASYVACFMESGRRCYWTSSPAAYQHHRLSARTPACFCVVSLPNAITRM